MYRRAIYASRACHEREIERNRAIHKKKMARIKPELDNKAPKTYLMRHPNRNAKREFMRQKRQKEIDEANRLLVSKMMAIAERENTEFVEHSIDAPRSLNLPIRKKELMRIDKENASILKRLERCAPIYDHSKWEKNWKVQEDLLASICEYPLLESSKGFKKRQRKKKKARLGNDAPIVSHNMLGDFIRLHQSSVAAKASGDDTKVAAVEKHLKTLLEQLSQKTQPGQFGVQSARNPTGLKIESYHRGVNSAPKRPTNPKRKEGKRNRPGRSLRKSPKHATSEADDALRSGGTFAPFRGLFEENYDLPLIEFSRAGPSLNGFFRTRISVSWEPLNKKLVFASTLVSRENGSRTSQRIEVDELLARKLLGGRQVHFEGDTIRSHSLDLTRLLWVRKHAKTRSLTLMLTPREEEEGDRDTGSEAPIDEADEPRPDPEDVPETLGSAHEKDISAYDKGLEKEEYADDFDDDSSGSASDTYVPLDEEEIAKVEAAEKIQSVIRGKKTRQSISEQKEAVEKIQSVLRGQSVRKDLEDQKDAAAKIQAVIRGKNTRQSISEQNEAVEKIQSVLRGQSVRKDLEEQKDAAAKIQAAMRGKKTRQSISEQKEAVEKIQSVLRGQSARKDLEDQKDAAAKIQAAMRGKKTRQSISEQTQAASKIQAVLRGKQTRTSFAAQDIATGAIESALKGEGATISNKVAAAIANETAASILEKALGKMY